MSCRKATTASTYGIGTNIVRTPTVGATIGRPHAKRIALQAGGETPPLQSFVFVRAGDQWSPLQKDTLFILSSDSIAAFSL